MSIFGQFNNLNTLASYQLRAKVGPPPGVLQVERLFVFLAEPRQKKFIDGNNHSAKQG
jgi:hypothetical protein